MITAMNSAVPDMEVRTSCPQQAAYNLATAWQFFQSDNNKRFRCFGDVNKRYILVLKQHSEFYHRLYFPFCPFSLQSVSFRRDYQMGLSEWILKMHLICNDHVLTHSLTHSRIMMSKFMNEISTSNQILTATVQQHFY